MYTSEHSYWDTLYSHISYLIKFSNLIGLHDHDTMKKLDDTKQKKQHSHEGKTIII